MTNKLVTIAELSIALGGISRPSIYRHIKNLPGFPQPVKIGASTRFRKSDVVAFIERADQNDVPWHDIDPGKPQHKAFIEPFNG